MNYAFVFILFGLICGFYAGTSSNLLLKVLAISNALAFTGVGLAYGYLGPKAFFKQQNGQLSLVSYIFYWPYHLLNALSLLSFRLSNKENTFDQITQNVYLGCRLSRRDEKAIATLGITSVLDLTCEFSELPALRELSYRCIPVLDTCAPTLKQLKTGAEWIRQESVQGKVYVHCALGHGRSATFVAAYLLLSGQAPTAQAAVDQIKARRPKIGLHPQQMALLQQLRLTV